MRLTQQKRPILPLQLQMAPMIDCVFLLLIFYLCTSSSIRQERTLASPLPQAGKGGGTPELLDPVRIRLAGGPEGVAVACDGQPCRGTGDLLAMLAARRALGEPPVIIEGGPEVPFGDMVAALDACHQAGLHRTAFSSQGATP